MNAPVIPPEEWRRAVVAGELRCARLRLLIKAVESRVGRARLDQRLSQRRRGARAPRPGDAPSRRATHEGAPAFALRRRAPTPLRRRPGRTARALRRAGRHPRRDHDELRESGLARLPIPIASTAWRSARTEQIGEVIERLDRIRGKWPAITISFRLARGAPMNDETDPNIAADPGATSGAGSEKAATTTTRPEGKNRQPRHHPA